MKKLDIFLRVILGLLCVSPVLGTLGIFPAPTRDLYNTDEAFSFITTIMQSEYLSIVLAVVFFLVLIATIRNQMAIAALLLLPLTVNIIGFHAFLDGGLFKVGASMAIVLAAINLYFLWRNSDRYKVLFAKSN